MSTRADVAGVRKAVLAHLTKYPDSKLSARDIARALGIASANTVRRTCEQLYEETLVWRIQSSGTQLAYKYQAAPRLRKFPGT
jgi:Fe2+ or Zn2+ uptake regulation protein